MILFLKDWEKHPGSIIHYDTKNISFLKMHLILKELGVQNNNYFLSLLNPALKNIDPYAENLSVEDKMMIMYECFHNFWYFLREIVRVPITGGYSEFILHRANLAIYWCYLNNITSYVTLPRQHGKTLSVLCLNVYYLYIRGKNFAFSLTTRRDDLRSATISLLKDIRDQLPRWMISKSSKDKENTQEITYVALNNVYRAHVAPLDEGSADSFGRGFTEASRALDEFNYLRYNWVFFSVMMGAVIAARENAKKNGLPYADIYTSTAASLDSKTGAFGYKLVSNALQFYDRLYDLKDQEDLEDVVRKNSNNNIIYILYSFLQLGKDMEWFKEQSALSQHDPAVIDKDLRCVWRLGTEDSLIGSETLNKIKESEIDPVWIEVHDGFTTNWYVDENDIKSGVWKQRPIVMGIDMSENIGNDFTVKVMIDPYSMKVLSVTRNHYTDLLSIALGIVEQMIDYPKLIIIPERNSVGAAVVDIILVHLAQHGVNAIHRVYNQIVQNRDDPKFKNIKIGLNNFTYGEIRKHFGFRTMGGGNEMSKHNTRKLLFSKVLMKCVHDCSDRMYDKTLIRELGLLSLSSSGRVDHPVGENDDTVISYLLACYLVLFGKNLHVYGINKELIEIGDKSADQMEDARSMSQSHRAYIANRIEELKNSKNRISSMLVHKQLDREISRLEELIRDVPIRQTVVGVDQLSEHRIKDNDNLNIMNRQKVDTWTKILVSPIVSDYR
jgi:hypothetical protein